MSNQQKVSWVESENHPEEATMVFIDKHLGFYDAEYYYDSRTHRVWKKENDKWQTAMLVGNLTHD